MFKEDRIWNEGFPPATFGEYYCKIRIPGKYGEIRIFLCKHHQREGSSDVLKCVDGDLEFDFYDCVAYSPKNYIKQNEFSADFVQFYIDGYPQTSVKYQVFIENGKPYVISSELGKTFLDDKCFYDNPPIKIRWLTCRPEKYLGK